MSRGLSRRMRMQGLFRTGSSWYTRDAVRFTRAVLVTAGCIALVTSCGNGDSGTGLVGAKAALPVASIGFNHTIDSVEIQRTSTVTATFFDSTGAPVSPGSTSWSVADTTIATVTSGGVVSGLRVGITTLTLTADKVARSLPVAVLPPAIVSITFATTSFTMTEGDTLTIPPPRIVDRTGAVRPPIDAPSYSSSSANVSVAPGGHVTAVTAGSATVTATKDTAHAVLTFTVLPAPIGRVKLIPSVLDLGVGHTIATQASAYSLSGAQLKGRFYTYAIDNTSIATVTPGGIVSGMSSGTATLTVATGTGSVQIPISVKQLKTNGFTIDLRFIGNVPTSVRHSATQAAARWQEIISAPLIPYHIVTAANDCGKGVPAMDLTETNVMIVIQADSIDGRGRTVGEGGPCVLRDDAPQLTALGTLTIDTADAASLAQQGILTDVITHEMGHILGIGTLWSDRSVRDSSTFFPNTAAGLGGPNPVFIGRTARIASAALGFTADSSLGVPIENTGTVGDGTRDAHWRASVFGHELMTGTIHNGLNPLSLVTIQTLGDFGYIVVPEAADDFDVANATSPGTFVQPSETIGTAVRETILFPKFTVTRTGRLKPIPDARPPLTQP